MPPAQAAVPFPIESLDGGGNNVANPTWGQAGRPYPRVGPAVYADGIGAPVTGPNARYVSNRIFGDSNQNVFSERRVTQWGWTWGQFLDHTFGLREETGPTATNFDIPFNSNDPLETFTNTLGVIPLTRTNATPGSGTSTANPRQQNNTTPSQINAFAVYGGTNSRLDWIRNGSNDGNPANNNATLMLPGGFLPRRDARGNANTAPTMAVDGRLLSNPNRAMVAGDVRANENIALTATHTLFAREHNRIVSLLPSSLSEEDKFQIARRTVIAEQQFITYNEWLPAMGVALPKYAGYNPNVNPAVVNEFAATGYRVHSQIHGEFEFEVENGTYTDAQLQTLRNLGAEVVVGDEDTEIAVSLNNGFFNPDLLVALRLDGIFASLLESQYKNEHQMDNQLRSVLFQVPVPGNPLCDLEPELEPCFRGVVDLGAIDIVRGRDHGIPRYNALRQAYGLPAKTSFTAITGESTDQFPAGSGVDNPNSLDIITLNNIDGGAEAIGSEAATAETMRSTVAARLRAIYGGNVNNVDAFTGVLAEPHVAGTEFGELQLAIWTRQFQALRDGDRFFYGNDQGLSFIRNTYGIDFHTTLGQVIARNTGLAEESDINVFLVDEAVLPAPACTVEFTQTTSWPSNFQVNMKITNHLPTALNGWTLQYEFANGQTFTDRWNGVYTQSGPNGRDVRVVNTPTNGSIGANGGSMDGIGFNASFDNFTNAKPVNFRVNNRRCATG
ncbi:MAG TPA: peroxidase family protein [Candidatus Limnocylindrales bacterium]|nr:peroxidase family protein [Candidatus Limnocylindrales bacterium]